MIIFSDFNDFYEHCSFKLYEEFGTKLPNGSYSGVLSDIVDLKVDASFKSGDYYINESLFGFTHPVYNEPYHTIQFIDKKSHLKDKNLFDAISIFMPSVYFFLEYISLFIFSLTIAFYLLQLSLRNRQSKSFLTYSTVIFFKKNLFKRVNFLSIFMIFFVLYKFILHQLLQNSIKTNKVIVDVSNLVINKEKLLTTKKTVCFFEDTKTNDYFKFAPNETLAHFVYNKLTDPTDRCFMITGVNFNKMKKSLDHYLFFIFKSFSDICLNIVKNFHQTDVFRSDNFYFDLLFTTYIRKNLPKELKHYLDSW